MAGRGRGIIVDLVANARDFIRGTDQAEKSLDKFGDSLDQVARDGDLAADKLERSFRDAARDVNQSADKIKRDAGDSLNEIGEEAGQTARETAASFDGSFESIIDGFQEVAAQAFAGLGKVGAAAGLAAAGAIGLIVAAYGKAQEAQEKLNETANRYYEALSEAGGQLDLNAQKQLELQAIAELGDGNQFLGQKRLNELIADGVTTREQALRLLTGQLIPADYAAIAAAKEELAQRNNINRVIGGSDAVKARKDALDDAQKLLDLQKQGAGAVQAQAVYAQQYRDTINGLVRSGAVAPGIGRAELADTGRTRP